MKNIFLGAFLILLTVNAQAQNEQFLDSLKKAAASNNDARTYHQIARTFLWERKLDSAIFYFQKSLANTDDQALEIQIRKGYGQAYLNLGFFALAQEQFFKTLKTAVGLNDSTQMALAYLNLGMVARGANLYDKSIQYYEEGLKLTSSAGVRNLIRNELGQALTQKKDYYKALTVFQEIFPQLKQQPQSSVYNSIGNTFIELKSYDSAYKYAALALSLDEASRDSAGLMWNWQLLGKYYYGVNQYGKAKTLSYAALRLNDRYGTESFDWNAVELPKLYQLVSNIYTAERKTDSLLWLKEQEATFYKRLWEEQKKHAAEFVFNSQEDEVKALLQKEKQTRKGLTQYYGIALVLLICILAYFILSGRDGKRKYTPYISIVVLVFLFEFLLVVLDPFIGKLTNDEPLYKFMINAVLALALVPVHFFGERLLKTFAIDIRIKKVE
jgi:tetratricopeptide (TPR) repeat protein